MTINDERKTKIVPFNSIAHGEVFTDEDGYFMMRITGMYDTDGVLHNAVDLESGDAYSFGEGESVIRLNRVALTIQN